MSLSVESVITNAFESPWPGDFKTVFIFYLISFQFPWFQNSFYILSYFFSISGKLKKYLFTNVVVWRITRRALKRLMFQKCWKLKLRWLANLIHKECFLDASFDVSLDQFRKNIFSRNFTTEIPNAEIIFWIKKSWPQNVLNSPGQGFSNTRRIRN